MLLIPAIDIKDGRCVRLRQGDPSSATVYSDNPVAIARHWVDQGARRLHVVDLNGARSGRAVNESVIRRIVQEVGAEVPVQLGGGLRDLDTIERYIDGGVRSTENADLASGYANVVVLSPFGGRNRTRPELGADPAGQFEGLRRFPGADLASQVEALRKQGSHVEVITPDADSRAAMGTNQTDPATRIPAARAGFAQGKQDAARVTFP